MGLWDLLYVCRAWGLLSDEYDEDACLLTCWLNTRTPVALFVSEQCLLLYSDISSLLLNEHVFLCAFKLVFVDFKFSFLLYEIEQWTCSCLLSNGECCQFFDFMSCLTPELFWFGDSRGISSTTAKASALFLCFASHENPLSVWLLRPFFMLLRDSKKYYGARETLPCCLQNANPVQHWGGESLLVVAELAW